MLYSQKLSAKAKRKLQKEHNAATSFAKTHSGGSFENSKHLQSDFGNEVLCLAALRCLCKILDAAGCFIKPIMQKLIQEKIVSLCFSVFSQLNTGVRQNLYFEPNCRKALLSALHALIVNPHHLCPPPLQYGVALFNVAEVQDPNGDVRARASELSRSAETLVHPRREVFYFPVEENAVKDMLVAKKKHKLNSAVFAAKQTPISFEKVIELGTEKVEEAEKSDEDEPIAVVEEVTIEEETSPEVVFELDDVESAGNCNNGELHKSVTDKTVESEAIEIDSDGEEEDEVEFVDLEQPPKNAGKGEKTPKKSTEKPSKSDEDVELVEEPLSTPKKVTTPGGDAKAAQKRKSEAKEQSDETESSEKKSKPLVETDDVEARVDDLVAEFVDELNDDV